MHTHSKVNYRGLRTEGQVHTIHNHLETSVNVSTKAKLKVEPLNSLDSSLFLSFLQVVLVLNVLHFSDCMKFTYTHSLVPIFAFHFCTLIKFEGRLAPLYFHKPLRYTALALLQLSLGGL